MMIQSMWTILLKKFSMHKKFLLIASVSGILGVAIGAFGAHGLKKIIQPGDFSIFQTGVQYQMYHTFALLATGILYEKFRNQWIRWSGVCFIVGILLFSGSLYMITLLKAYSVAVSNGIGIITPIGGLFFIMGWMCMLIGVVNRVRS